RGSVDRGSGGYVRGARRDPVARGSDRADRSTPQNRVYRIVRRRGRGPGSRVRRVGYLRCELRAAVVEPPGGLRYDRSATRQATGAGAPGGSGHGVLREGSGGGADRTREGGSVRRADPR